MVPGCDGRQEAIFTDEACPVQGLGAGEFALILIYCCLGVHYQHRPLLLPCRNLPVFLVNSDHLVGYREPVNSVDPALPLARRPVPEVLLPSLLQFAKLAPSHVCPIKAAYAWAATLTRALSTFQPHSTF